MVRSGRFELQLVRLGPTGSWGACPEVIDGSSSRTFAVAAPGEVFQVKATLHGKDDGVKRKATLRIDGQNVGFNMHIDTPGSVQFKGFVKYGDTNHIKYESFVFAQPAVDAAKQAHNARFEEGGVVAKFYQYEYTGELKSVLSTQCDTVNPTIPQMPEGKKFFLAPSLATGRGAILTGAGFSNRETRLLSDVPEAVLELRYETAATLLLRGVLKRSDPQHRAILQMFPDTAEGAGAGQHASSSQAGPGAAAAAGQAPARRAAAGVAEQRRVKRERQEEEEQQEEQRHAGRRRQQPQEEEVIDLTQYRNEGDEVLAAKQRDQVLECDLTGEGEGRQPTWRARRKQAINLA